VAYTVKKVAELAGVSVRTLHHYDEIKLLRPASVSQAGYRLYTDQDLERLQQILFFRELGFSLTETKAILDNPQFDRRAALLTHKKLLVERQRRLGQLIQSVEQTIEAMERGIPMKKESMFDGFDMSEIEKHKEQYKDEVRAKYPKEIVEESERRVARYGKSDWAAIQAEGGAINLAMADLMGHDPASPEVQAVIGRWFNLINDRFYTCTPEIFRGLGDLYVQDERFTAFYDKVKPGLAPFMREAMQIYADRLTANS